MSPAKRRLSNILAFSAILLVAIGISSALYFFKIEQNEDYQNQLHFRELNIASHSFQSSLKQFKNVGSTVLELKEKSENKPELERYISRVKSSSALKRIELHSVAKQNLPASIRDNLHVSKTFTLTDSFTYFFASDQQLHSNIVTLFKAPTADFIPDDLLSFPLVIIADWEGRVLAKKSYFKNSTNAADLQFRSVNKVLFALEKQQRKANQLDDESSMTSASYSGSVEIEVGSVTYRVFIQPITFAEAVEEITYFTIGFAPLKDIQIDKLSISSESGLWILLALLLLCASIPVLKIRFTAIKHHFTQTDVSLFFAGVLLLLGIICIIVNHKFFYSYLIETKYQQAETIYNIINAEFKKEVNKVNSMANQRNDTFFNQSKPSIHECKSKLVKSHPLITQDTSDSVTSYNCTSPSLFVSSGEGQKEWFVENIFRLNSDGFIPRTKEVSTGTYKREPIIRISQKSFNFTDFHLGHRDYFNRALNCDLWFENDGAQPDCKDGFIIQRIKNVSDSRLSTQFAYAYFAENSQDESTPKVISVSAKLTTFLHRTLPIDFGYAVVDQNGLVLYHSDESKVLLENILVDTYGDPNINALISSSDVVRSGTATPQSIRFKSQYRNANHLFVGGDLSTAAPWKLLVFYQTDDIGRNSLWMVMLATVLFLGMLSLLFFWNRYGTKQYFWSKLISYHPEYSEQYARYAWLLVGCTFFSILSLGVLHNLYGRFFMFFLLSSLVLFLISRQFKIIPSRDQIWAHLIVPFLSMAILFAVLYAINFVPSVAHINSLDFVLFMFGSLILLLTGLYCFRKPANSVYSRLISAKRFVRLQQFLNIRIKRRARPYRYNWGYVVYLSCFLWFFSAVPANIMVNAIDHYLLDFQASKQANWLRESESSRQEVVTNYVDLMSPNESESKSDKQNILMHTQNEDPIVTCLFKQKNCTPNLPDHIPWIKQTEDILLVDPMLNVITSSQQIGGAIHADFFQFAQRQGHQPKNSQNLPVEKRLEYDGNKFILSGMMFDLPFLFLFIPLAFLSTLLFVKKFVVHRLMGEHLPDNFRSFAPAQMELCFNQIAEMKKIKSKVRAQLIRCNHDKALEALSHALQRNAIGDQVWNINDLLSKQTELKGQLERQNRSHQFIVISGLEYVAFDKELRLAALSLLATLDKTTHLDIVFICDIAPLYRLCKQSAYPNCDPASVASLSEVAAWSRLLANYEKLYYWNPTPKSRAVSVTSLEEVLQRESIGWPVLLQIKRLYLKHKETYSENKWKPDQIIEFFASHAGAIYRHKWELCTLDERLMLFQLANGASVNPANAETLEQLVKRGYIYRDCGWFIINESFRRFVLFAEKEQIFAEWLAETTSNSWQMVRVPIFIAVIVLTAFIIIGTGQSFQSVLATATATIGVIPLLLRNLSFFKSAAAVNQE